LAAPLLISPASGILPAFGLSSSARSAPLGSDAIAAMVPARDPKPNRCSARAAPRGSRVMTLFLRLMALGPCTASKISPRPEMQEVSGSELLPELFAAGVPRHRRRRQDRIRIAVCAVDGR